MRTYYVDETGFTGEDLMAEDQPIFGQAPTTSATRKHTTSLFPVSAA